MLIAARPWCRPSHHLLLLLLLLMLLPLLLLPPPYPLALLPPTPQRNILRRGYSRGSELLPHVFFLDDSPTT